jgi:hypothetical protein
MVFQDMAVLTDSAGHLAERRVPHLEIVVPSKIWLEGDTLKWDWEFGSRGVPQLRKPSGAILQQFITLWKSDADVAIEKFAKRWGPLRYHPDGRLDDSIQGGSEALSYWRFLSRRAYAALAVAAELKEGRPGTEEHLSLISSSEGKASLEKSGFFGFPDWSRRERINEMRTILSGEFSFWLQRFSPEFEMSYDRRQGWHLEVGYRYRVLPAISMQLALTAAGGDLYTCSGAGCGELYIRTGRRPNSGQGNYCKNCGKAAALRNADEHRRERKAEARRLHESGMRVTEIAKRLNADRETITNWVTKRKQQ